MELLSEKIHAAPPRPIRVAQFGEGNFLRAFVDWMIQRMNERAGFDAGVAVIQPRAGGRVKALARQDGLYTLLLEGIRNGAPFRETGVIECVRQCVDPYADYDGFLALAEVPTLRFVFSNTTEAGITFRAGDRADDRPPSAFPAKLTAFLYRRYCRYKGDLRKGLILIPCELIEHNGERLRETVLRYAALWSLGECFSRWVEKANLFCGSLVDRIVPGYPSERAERLEQTLGYADAMLDVGELYYQWIIEGPAELGQELPFERAGLSNVRIVPDLAAYRTRKVRILNGAHTCLTPVAYLYGLDTVRQAVEDRVVGAFVRRAVEFEILLTLKMDRRELESFAADVFERFRNPYLRHELTSIALNSFSKFETRVLPSLLGYVRAKGKLPRRLVFSLAALFAFYRGDRAERPVELRDEPDVLGRMHLLWADADAGRIGLSELADRVLAFRDVWKRDLCSVPELSGAVAADLSAIETSGMKSALTALESDWPRGKEML